MVHRHLLSRYGKNMQKPKLLRPPTSCFWWCFNMTFLLVIPKFWPFWTTWCGMALCWHAFWHISWYIICSDASFSSNSSSICADKDSDACSGKLPVIYAFRHHSHIYSSNFSEMHSGNLFWHFVFSWHILRHIFLIYILTFIWGFAKLGNRITSEHHPSHHFRTHTFCITSEHRASRDWQGAAQWGALGGLGQ